MRISLLYIFLVLHSSCFALMPTCPFCPLSSWILTRKSSSPKRLRLPILILIFSFFVSKHNSKINSIRKIIKNYKMDMLKAKMHTKYIFKFWYFFKTLKIKKWEKMRWKHIFDFFILSRRYQQEKNSKKSQNRCVCG